MHNGAVYIYDLSNLNSLNFAKPKTEILCTNPSSRFGRQLTWINNGDLLISAPQYSAKAYYVPHDVGKLFLYESAHTLNGSLDQSDASKIYDQSDRGCKLGMKLTWD